jgi:hypothetical protein
LDSREAAREIEDEVVAAALAERPVNVNPLRERRPCHRRLGDVALLIRRQ